MKDNFEAFADGSGRLADRLAERHKRIVNANSDAFIGKVVIDLAASNGRWSYASIAAGARKVVSIEGRPERAQAAKGILSQMGVADKIDINIGDMYSFLDNYKGEPPDTILCLGIYYHIMDHYKLLQSMAALAPGTLLIDGGFVRSFRNSVVIMTEDPNAYSNALSRFPGQKEELVGIVSLGLMLQMAWNVGYNCRPIIWDPKDVVNVDAVRDYIMGRRFTLRLERAVGDGQRNWKAAWAPALEALDPSLLKMLDQSTHDQVADHRVRRPLETMQFTVL